MIIEQVITVLATAIVTGALSAFATITALRVHITYLRETTQRHDEAINRAHERIDEIDHCHVNPR